MKITCKNCGWSWNKKDGGANPCKCHKCGYNNKDMYGKKIVGLGGVSEFITVETFDGQTWYGKKINSRRDAPKSAKLMKFGYDENYNELKLYYTSTKKGLKYFIVVKK